MGSQAVGTGGKKLAGPAGPWPGLESRRLVGRPGLSPPGYSGQGPSGGCVGSGWCAVTSEQPPPPGLWPLHPLSLKVGTLSGPES